MVVLGYGLALLFYFADFCFVDVSVFQRSQQQPFSKAVTPCEGSAISGAGQSAVRSAGRGTG
jgi:hypothetical protein